MKKKIENDELKQIQLDILDNVASFCESKNINYFLAYGTLIGAIRHKGYIPWDDDIDIAMPRPDYQRFMDLYNKEDSNYKMICYELNEEYNLPFGKVTDIRTDMIEGMYQEHHNYGVYIDVFPIDGFQNKRVMFQAQWLRRALNAKLAVIGKGRGVLGDMKIVVGKIALSFVSVKHILFKINKLCMTYQYDKCNKVGYIPTLSLSRSGIVEKKLIDTTLKGEFEGRTFRIPIGYDLYLKQIYGDYMQLPPKEKQVTHHTFQAWWK